MPPMKMKRVNRLRWLLENPPRPMDMRWWVDVPQIKEIGCGTAACALGTAALDPELMAHGLHIDEGLRPVFLEAFGIKAGEDFFGFSEIAADDLFYWGYSKRLEDVTAADVLALLDQIIANDGYAPGEPRPST